MNGLWFKMEAFRTVLLLLPAANSRFAAMRHGEEITAEKAPLEKDVEKSNLGPNLVEGIEIKKHFAS